MAAEGVRRRVACFWLVDQRGLRDNGAAEMEACDRDRDRDRDLVRVKESQC